MGIEAIKCLRTAPNDWIHQSCFGHIYTEENPVVRSVVTLDGYYLSTMRPCYIVARLILLLTSSFQGTSPSTPAS